ncbi:39S ribosomal protein L43, mitochondrial [Toxocara canis]|uniref:Large ribosomal subunit protein mL43 n=1 Tax=Toxocara canis TaxID=6265 RepID=A0A0B2VXW5_TOXCA|nr:39S ribosomal protein L43, mitochondrial [Toxocara canis]
MPSRARVDRIKQVYTAANALNYGWRLSDFPKTPMNNGVTRYIPQAHRITLRFCKQSESSLGMRNFIENSVRRFAQQNPSIVVYILPIRNSTPTLRAEYGNGRMAHVNATNFSAEQVAQHMNLLRTRSGLPVVRLESRQTAAVTSVQGMWNPLLNIDTEQNIADLPQKKFSERRCSQQSATEYVASLVSEQ